jgi:hypothetical protein
MLTSLTIQFDDLPTNTSGVGFHPTDPKAEAVSYKDLYFQSFTLLNPSSANLTHLDQTCSRSWPNAVFASRKPGFAWPRISLYDLSKPKSELEQETSKGTFGLVSLWIRPTGIVPGARDKTITLIQITLLPLHSVVSGDENSKEGYPGIIRGQPQNYPTANVSSIGMTSPGGIGMPGFQLNVRRIFGDRFAIGADVMGITAQVFRRDSKTNIWNVAEDWEFCIDNIELEISTQVEQSAVYGHKYVITDQDGYVPLESEDFGGDLNLLMDFAASTASDVEKI